MDGWMVTRIATIRNVEQQATRRWKPLLKVLIPGLPPPACLLPSQKWHTKPYQAVQYYCDTFLLLWEAFIYGAHHNPNHDHAGHNEDDDDDNKNSDQVFKMLLLEELSSELDGSVIFQNDNWSIDRSMDIGSTPRCVKS
jgi:hypothetical protein